MKKRKRQTCLLCIVLLFVSLLCGCQGASDKEDSNQGTAGASSSLYEEGLALVSDMYALANDEAYMEVAASTDGIKEHIDAFASCSYDKPSGVYRAVNIINLTGAAVLKEVLEKGTLSEAADRRIKNISGAQFCNILVARMGGAQNLAALSIISTSSCFVNLSLKEPEVYIYTYENGYPVIVSFVPGKNGAVSASAQCLLADSFRGANAEAVTNALGIIYPGFGLDEITD